MLIYYNNKSLAKVNMEFNLEKIKENSILQKAIIDQNYSLINQVFSSSDEKNAIVLYCIVNHHNKILDNLFTFHTIDYNISNNIFINQATISQNQWALNFLLEKSLNNHWYQDNSSEKLCAKAIKIAIKNDFFDSMNQIISWYQDKVDDNIGYFLSSEKNRFIKNALNEKSFLCADLLLKYNKSYLENNISLWQKIFKDNELSDYFFDKNQTRTRYKDIPEITVIAIMMDKNFSEKEADNIKKCWSYFVSYSKNMQQTQPIQNQIDNYMSSLTSEKKYNEFKNMSQYLLNIRLEKNLPQQPEKDKILKI
jgi:hypothetical protein